jgi:peroxiredoxin Q/BCP
MWTRLLIALIVVLGLVIVAKKVFADSTPAVGTAAPDFTLSSQEGNQVSLKDFHGKWVVLYFYPKDFTSGCTIEAHNFQRDIAKYEQHNAVVVGVSVDSANSHREFCAKQGLTFKLLADTDKKVSLEYGSLTNVVVFKMSSRNTFLIDPEGRIAQVWTGVRPAGHSEEVLGALALRRPGASPGSPNGKHV